MGQLNNLFVSSSYQGLLKMTDSTNGLTNTLQTVQTGDGDNSPLQMSLTEVNISGSLTVNGQVITINTGSLVTTSSFNAYTSSVNTQLAGLNVETGSLQNQINGLVTTGSLTSLSSSIAVTDLSQNNVIATLATTSSLITLSGSIATTDLGQNNRLTSIEGITGSLATTSSLTSLSSSIATTDLNQNNVIAGLATTSSLTSLSSSIATTDLGQNNRLTSLEGVTGSINRNGLITTGSAGGNQSITGSLGISGTLTATSASITYLETVYETASIIYSSGSNQFGDASNDTQTLFGTVVLPSGPLVITGSVTSSLGFVGNLTGTASYATNALSASNAINSDTSISSSFAQNAISASQAQNAVSASYAPDTTNTGSFAITGSNVFKGNQTISGSVKIVNNNTGNDLVIGEIGSGNNEIIINGSGGKLKVNAIYDASSDSFGTLTIGGNGALADVLINAQTNMYNTFIQGAPGILSSSLNVSGSSNLNGQLLITGSIIPGGHNEFDLGTPTAQWRDLYLSSGSIFMDGHLLIDFQGESNAAIYSPQATGSVEIHNNLIVLSGATVNGNTTINGSLSVPSITGSLVGTASYATQALSASEATHAVSASYAPMPSTSEFATTGSNNFIGDQTITGSFNITFTGNTGNPLVDISTSSINLTSKDNTSITLFSQGNGNINLTAGGSNPRNNINVDGKINQQQAGSTPNSLKDTNIDGAVNITNPIATGNINIQVESGSFTKTAINLQAEKSFIQAQGDLFFVNTWDAASSGSISFNSPNGINFLATSSVIISGSNNVTIRSSNINVTGSVNILGQLNLRGDQVISGSLLTNTLNNGLIKVTTEAQNSSSLAVPFGYISASAAVSQSNLIFGTITGGNGGGQLSNNVTGSIVISGSNNIIFGGNRVNTLVTQGTYGYIGGNNNIFTTIPTITTSSIIRPAVSNNNLNSLVTFAFTTSSLLAPGFASNNVLAPVAINHQSSSVSMTGNIVGINLTSNANTTILDTIPTIQNNTIIGSVQTLNHNSSSIQYTQNVGAINVTNNYSSSVSTAVNNITVTQNFAGGSNQQLFVSGSNSGTRRTFNSNFLMGRVNVVNSFHSGSPFTGGHLVSTALIGQELIVSASHTTTTVGGTVIVGRYNATGSLQESSQDTVFVVGTGTAAGNRRNAIHVDSTNNIRMTGSVNISGSLNSNGNTTITGSLGVSGSSNFRGGNVSISGSQLKTNNFIIFDGSPNEAGAMSNFVAQQMNTRDIFGFTNILNSELSSGSNFNLSTQGGSNYSDINFKAAYGGTEVIFKIANSNGTRNVDVKTDTMTVTGSVNISGSNHQIIGSSSLNGQTTVSGALRVGTSNDESVIQSLGGNQWLYRNTSNYNTVIGNVGGVNNGFFAGSEKNMVLNGFNTPFATGSNNVIIQGPGDNFISGSNNIFIGGHNGQAGGSGNLLIGGMSYSSGSIFDNKFEINNNSTRIFHKSGSDPLQIGSNTQITGSLNVSGDVLFASGSNKTMGTAVLDNGSPSSVVVSNSLVTANSLIFLTKQTLTNAHMVAVSSKGTNTFTITSNGNGDTDTVAYLIINPS